MTIMLTVSRTRPFGRDMWKCLKCLWTENWFCFVLKSTIKNTRFQSLRSPGLKLTILQASKVVLFYTQNGQGNGSSFIQNDQVVTSLWCHEFICAVPVSCWQARDYGRKHVQRFRKQLCWFCVPATQYRPRCLFSFLSAILRERLWHQSDFKSWHHVVFWPRDSNTIFEGKNARIWRLVKSSILSPDFSNFGNVYFARQTLKRKKNNFRFIGTLNLYIFFFLRSTLKCDCSTLRCLDQNK